jgi:hypothetical protein
MQHAGRKTHNYHDRAAGRMVADLCLGRVEVDAAAGH